jgi:NAD(P)-dependent dehydrogenase (short-subunit alcohol dehydrogenase family)
MRLFREIDEAGWMKTLDTVFMAVVRLVRAFIDPMRVSGWERIVLIAPADAVQPYVDELRYCPPKSGVLSLAKGLSKTYSKEGVLANAVSPAFIATPMTDAMIDKRAKEQGTSFDEVIQSFLKEERPFMELKQRGRAKGSRRRRYVPLLRESQLRKRQ